LEKINNLLLAKVTLEKEKNTFFGRPTFGKRKVGFTKTTS